MTGTYGQDWASYQDAAPSTAGLGFAFVKATEGLGYTSPDHGSQIAHARANGLVTGHYHYPHMANDPVAEADRFLGVAHAQPGDVITLDWEGYDPANKGVPMARKVSYKAAWLAHVRAALPQHQVGTYCNTDYLNRDPHGPYGDFLWIATANRPAGQPGIVHPWLFHQYGASGVDRDYCPLTLAQLKTWAHAKENDDMPLTDAEISKIADATAARVAGFKNLKLDKIDARQRWVNAEANSLATKNSAADILTAMKGLGAPVLTDAQLTALASKVAADPVLAAAIAAKVDALIAARYAE